MKYFLPFGHRVYAIGDIHGCYGLLLKLIDRINSHRLKDPNYKHLTLVYLGDYIDRGPASKKVLDFILQDLPWVDTTIRLKGNHEDMFQAYLNKNYPHSEMFLKFGGEETLKSYGKLLIPDKHIDFINSSSYHYRLGDFLFVHAGINPLKSLETQSNQDYAWINRSFYNSKKDFGVYIVHGHMTVKQVEIKPNRINVDTGSYKYGQLSCAVIQNNEVSSLTVS